jgi:hypothetical protein
MGDAEVSRRSGQGAMADAGGNGVDNARDWRSEQVLLGVAWRTPRRRQGLGPVLALASH